MTTHKHKTYLYGSHAPIPAHGLRYYSALVYKDHHPLPDLTLWDAQLHTRTNTSRLAPDHDARVRRTRSVTLALALFVKEKRHFGRSNPNFFLACMPASVTHGGQTAKSAHDVTPMAHGHSFDQMLYPELVATALICVS